MKLRNTQINLLKQVARNPNVCVHQLCKYRGDYQSYQTYLRDRLYRLLRRGLVEAVPVVSPKTGNLYKRLWRITASGTRELQETETTKTSV